MYILYSWPTFINAIGSQKISRLRILGLSAAFDTNDHSMLIITCLSSWFGVRGSVLNWFKSYLPSQSFRVKCNKIFLSYLLMWCSQGSVLGPLLFIMYTTALSTLISSLYLNHHLYADDTLLFPPVTHLSLTPALPTFRMLCILYPSGCLPTFWLVTLQKLNLSSLYLNNNSLKLPLAHLIRFTLLVILASFLTNILLFLIRYLLFLNPATQIFVNTAASAHILISKQPAPLLPPSFTLSYRHRSSARQHPSYGDCLEVKREYYQNCSVLGCVTQCSQSAVNSCEQLLQVLQQIGFVTLSHYAMQRRLPRVVLL